MTQYLATALMSAATLGHKRAGYLGIFTGGQSRDILRGGTATTVESWYSICGRLTRTLYPALPPW